MAKSWGNFSGWTCLGSCSWKRQEGCVWGCGVLPSEKGEGRGERTTSPQQEAYVNSVQYHACYYLQDHLGRGEFASRGNPCLYSFPWSHQHKMFWKLNVFWQTYHTYNMDGDFITWLLWKIMHYNECWITQTLHIFWIKINNANNQTFFFWLCALPHIYANVVKYNLFQLLNALKLF